MPGRISNGNLSFLLSFLVLVVVMGLITHYINTRPYVFEASDDAAAGKAAALSKAQDAYAAVGNLLTTLATGLLAGLGVFFTKTTNHRHPAGGLWLSAICVCVSVYFGYISSQNVGWAIEFQIPSVNVPKLQLPRQLQFFSLVLGVYFFANSVRRDETSVD
jgi:hypothetical protein